MPRNFPLRITLTPRDRRTVGAIAEAMFSDDGALEPARVRAHVDAVDALVSSASRFVRWGLRLALLAVRLSPILLGLRLRLFESLPPDRRVALLERLEAAGTTLSLAFVGWRSIMTLVFYEDAAELRRIGYAGDARSRYRRLPLAAVPAPDESGVRLRDPAREGAVGEDDDRVEVA